MNASSSIKVTDEGLLNMTDVSEVQESKVQVAMEVIFVGIVTVVRDEQ